MADFGRGIKAGVITGVVYVVIYVILGLVGSEFLYLSGFIHAAGIGPSFLGIFTPLIRGIVFGAVFAALYHYLPGVGSIVKGVVLSLFLWIVTVIEVIYTTLGWPWTNDGITGVGTYYGGTLVLSSGTLALIGIMSALVFGALTGFLWDRFRAKELTEERKGSSVLLISFILGGILWVIGAVAFLIGVVIVGVPAIEPGPFWWYSVLYVSVVFLGLPGWVLVLVAWRKTRRGESGFKWGVAGGVMMALTGMLLTGALAIIGGVLSRRKPASEPGTAAIGQ